MLDFALGFAVGVIVSLALVIVDARRGRARRAASLAKARNELLTDMAEEARINPFPPGEDFVYRRRAD